MSLGELIKEKRLEKKKTQQNIADALGVSLPLICRLEKNIANPPGEDKLKKLADVLDVDRDRLILLANKLPKRIKKSFQEKPRYLPFFRTIDALNKDSFDDVFKYAAKKISEEDLD